jgi:hypothetical protein
MMAVTTLMVVKRRRIMERKWKKSFDLEGDFTG